MWSVHCTTLFFQNTVGYLIVCSRPLFPPISPRGCWLTISYWPAIGCWMCSLSRWSGFREQLSVLAVIGAHCTIRSVMIAVRLRQTSTATVYIWPRAALPTWGQDWGLMTCHKHTCDFLVTFGCVTHSFMRCLISNGLHLYRELECSHGRPKCEHLWGLFNHGEHTMWDWEGRRQERKRDTVR